MAKKFKQPKKYYAIGVFMVILVGLICVAMLWDTEKRTKKALSEQSDEPVIVDFETLLASDNAVLLKSRFDILKRIDMSRSPFPVVAENLDMRVRIAERVRELNHSDDSNLWADYNVLNTLIAKEAVFFTKQMPFSNDFEKLNTLSEEFSTHENQRLAREGQTARLVIKVLNLLRNEKLEDFESSLVTETNSLIDQFPQDYELATGLRLLTVILQQKSDYRPYKVKLLELLGERYQVSEDSKLREFGDSCQVEAILAKSGIDDLKSDIEIDPPGIGKQLVEIVDSVLKTNEISNELCTRLISVSQLLEIYHEPILAGEAYQKILDSAGELESSESIEVAKLASEGIIRCNAVGKPFSIDARTLDGNSIKGEDLKGSPVIVCFLSGKSQSIERLFTSLRSLERYRQSGLRTIFVVTDVENNVARDIAKQAKLTKIVVVSDKLRDSCFVEQFPPAKTPVFLLIDREGILREPVVDSSELMTRLQNLIYNFDG